MLDGQNAHPGFSTFKYHAPIAEAKPEQAGRAGQRNDVVSRRLRSGRISAYPPLNPLTIGARQFWRILARIACGNDLNAIRPLRYSATCFATNFCASIPA